MSAFTSFTVQDRATPTPADHIYVPQERTSDGVNVYREAGATPLNDSIYTSQMRDTGTNTKVRIKLAVPTTVTQVISGVNVVVEDSVDYFDGTFTFSKKRSDQDRKNFMGRLATLLDDTSGNIPDMLIKREGTY